MSEIDFQNGFALGLAMAYKKEAEAATVEGLIIKKISDAINLSTSFLSTNDQVDLSLSLPDEKNINDTIALLPQIITSDSVTVTLS